MNRFLSASAPGVWVLLALGCATDLTTDVPARFDLSGRWEAHDDAGPTGRRERHRAPGAVGFDPASLPMLSAPRMEIEQNSDSMGIAYDQGIYRDITWGERELRLVDVEAGWDGPDLVIRTDAVSYEMVERFDLSEDGRVLRVKIRIEPGRGEPITRTRVFHRE